MSGAKPRRKNVGHKFRGKTERVAGDVLVIAYCHTCEKTCYRSRKDVRKAISQIPLAQAHRLRAYKCPDGKWHFGRLPSAVKAGERTIHDPIPGDPDERSKRRDPART